jgi:hypothetical protein
MDRNSASGKEKVMAEGNPVQAGYKKIPIGRLEPGEMGVLVARAGAGKTACLTHLALGYLLNGEHVLHVCVDVVPDKVKLWYHKLLRDIFSSQPEGKISDLQHAIEPRRFIMSFLNQTFSPEKLETGIENLKEQANFVPALIILDGLEYGRSRELFEKIGEIAKRRSAPVWVSARSHRHIPDVNERGIPYPIDVMDDLFNCVFMLEPGNDCIRLRALKVKGDYNPPGFACMLDVDTLLPLEKSCPDNGGLTEGTGEKSKETIG